MRIVGSWLLCEDGVTRPTVRAQVLAADGTLVSEDFLVDLAADRSVFSAVLQTRLGLPTDPSPAGEALVGISGASTYVLVTSLVEFTRDDGGTARVRGQFAVFTDRQATDVSILGRDVLDLFDVICSRRRNEVLLLAGSHQYHVTSS
jgi:hypothetical protein